MAASSRILRALQMRRIAGNSRKTNLIASLTPNTPSILKSLPEHKPLLPLLLSYNVPSKLAKACADRYDVYADQLRSETESKLVPYLVDQTGGRPARVYSLFLDNYNQTLRDWAQSILDTALRSLKRGSAELENWDVTYPPPLWLPSPPDTHPMFTRANTRNTHVPCPLSSTSTPSHAFPTTYPPPLRPTSRLPRVEWTRIPAASPNPPSTSTIDLDSLCTQFTRSLVIDENPTQSSRHRTSISSLPDPSKQSTDVTSPYTKPSKRKVSHVRPSQEIAVKLTPTIPPFKITKSHRPSTSSFSYTSTTVGKPQRKASASTTPSAKRTTSVSSTHSGSPRHTTSQSLGSSTSHRSPSAGSLFADLNLDSTVSSSVPPHSPFNPTRGLTTLTEHNIPYCHTGPITPPTHSLDLFLEPLVVSPTPIQLSSEPFFKPITGPLAQAQLHDNYLLNSPLVPSHDYDSSTLGLFSSSSFLKGTCDVPNRISINPVAPTSQEPFISDFLGIYEAF